MARAVSQVLSQRAVNAHHMLPTSCMCFTPVASHRVHVLLASLLRLLHTSRFTPCACASHLVHVLHTLCALCMSAYAWRVVWSTVTREVDLRIHSASVVNTPVIRRPLRGSTSAHVHYTGCTLDTYPGLNAKSLRP